MIDPANETAGVSVSFLKLIINEIIYNLIIYKL